MSCIIFEDAGASKSGKTHQWRVQPKDNGALAACLGVVSWYAPWRKYAFSPYSNTVFEQDCLRDIAHFCEHRTKEQKAGGVARRCLPETSGTTAPTRRPQWEDMHKLVEKP